MLDVFERNDMFPKREHAQQRRATLAAALLHDVGHGPYSHVFEEVANELAQGQNHETYTRDIIDQTDVKSVLRKHGVFDRTKKFFTAEAGADPYTRIISSQMDCDRLDFLVRDRYYTGIRSAAIDLAWLFDSLRIEEVPIDPVRQLKAYSFVVLPKGISVVEEFVLAYMKMYQNVYFHKTTRAVQHMVSDIISMAASNELRSNRKIKDHPIVRYFRDKRYRSLDDYLCLDDSSVVSLLRIGRSNMDRCLSWRGGTSSGIHTNAWSCRPTAPAKSGRWRPANSSRNSGIARSISSTIACRRRYKQYDVMDENYLKNILVKKDGEYEPLG